MALDDANLTGRQVVFRLFVALWIATLLSLLWFARIAKQQYGDAVGDRVYYALIGDLLAPIIAWFIFKAMNNRRDTKTADIRTTMISSDSEE